MIAWLMFAAASVVPIGQHFLADPSRRTPILPAAAVPRVAGGWLPPPGPPSPEYIRSALAAAARLPGDVIVVHGLERERVSAPRLYPGVGLAIEWQLTYRCQVVGPDGPYTVYTDRTALVRLP
jgi:hypothetical protein